jgi:hypothetical protein
VRAARAGRGLTGVREPEPLEAEGARYAALPLPPYRYLPGRAPHPTRDPRGHSFAREAAPERPDFDADDWAASEAYRFGIDLYNHAYWWECHEVLEGLWHATGRRSAAGLLLRGLIQLSAANWKRHQGAEAGAQSLARKARANLERAVRGARAPRLLGIDVPELCDAVRAHFAGETGRPPPIRLRLPDGRGGDERSGDVD